jgi:hypothetical protein
MSKSEAWTQASGMMAASRHGAVTFRNNVGGAWAGRKIKTLPNGDAIIRQARWIDFGLCPGSGDTIGWRSVTVTPDMVGKTIAIFASIEYKDDTGRARPDQVKWHDVVCRAGGLSGFARSDDDVRRILDGERIDP